MWQLNETQVEKEAPARPLFPGTPKTLPRLPAWLIWGGVIGLVQIFAPSPR
jgi:hypothetical protein